MVPLLFSMDMENSDQPNHCKGMYGEHPVDVSFSFVGDGCHALVDPLFLSFLIRLW